MRNSKKDLDKPNNREENLQNLTSFVTSSITETLACFFANPIGFIQDAVRQALAEQNASTKPTKEENDIISLDVAYETILKEHYVKSYIYELVRKNMIPSHKAGTRTVFSKTELLAWVAAGCYDVGKAEIAKQATDYVNKNPLDKVNKNSPNKKGGAAISKK